MRVFKINELTHAFAGKSIFNKAELMVTDCDRIGLVGPNGCGKSTFLKILTGEVVPDVWNFESNGKLKIGYLDQYADIGRDITVYRYLDDVFADLYEINDEVDRIYAGIPELDEDGQMTACGRAQALVDYLNEREFDRIPKKIESVLSGLGFNEADRDKPTSQLSGGMKTKLILAKLLLTEHDLLVLDEPTNFLDIGYIGWLGDYLSRLKYAYIVISHDRAFLNRVSNKIVEIANRKFKVYEGDYEFYIKEKARREAIQTEQSISQEKFVARSEAYVNTFLYNNSGGQGKTKATWLKRMLENLERIERPDEIIKPRFKFRHSSGATKQILSLDSAEVGYDGSAVLPPLTLKVARGEKIVFKGFNGIGKTTLLKTIHEDIPLVSGSMEFGENIESVFLRQEEDYENNFSHFDKHERKLLGIKKGRQQEITVIEFAKEYYPEKTQKELQAAMFSCGLNEKHFFNRVRTLSGGEMTKLRLCLAMQKPINLIILDEPTNHLDIYSKEVLMHALEEFPGTVLMTTHDVNADVSWATKIINLEDLFI
ncbi:MAG: ABC-F family ATP-binding cassette domain-containing protein [Clostridiales bacterium]|jgi:ATPase subunit of ABC transporter with duplicated ATPase domains|nr:ABC-F family ATP-binding cassette domain-containing protein [Clostridiales bacterium]